MSWLPFLRRKPELERAADPLISLDEYIGLLNQFTFQGHTYTLPSATQEEIGGAYAGLARAGYKSNGVVFACMLVRMLLFSEARFQFRQLRSGRPGKLFGSASLAPLESPWPGATTGDMLSRMIQYADLAGNAFVARRAGKLEMLRPDWVDIVVSSPDSDRDVGVWDVGAEVVGYVYHPGGRWSGKDANYFLAEQVAHFAPIPDPEARFRGMSWLSPIAREVMADKATTEHKLSLMENAATPNMIVKFEVEDLERFRGFVEKFREQHEGRQNRGRTLFMSAGMDATVVGQSLRELEFKATQGAGETRIAAAAGVPPILAGFSEGLASATYSNYGMARRRFADGTMRPLWRNVAASLARLIQVPTDAELWYDDRDIPFLQEDVKDAADVLAVQSVSIRSLTDAGFAPDAVVDAVTSGDLERLKGSHSGAFSVQLLPPGTTKANGNGAGRGVDDDLRALEATHGLRED